MFAVHYPGMFASRKTVWQKPQIVADVLCIPSAAEQNDNEEDPKKDEEDTKLPLGCFLPRSWQLNKSLGLYKTLWKTVS